MGLFQTLTKPLYEPQLKKAVRSEVRKIKKELAKAVDDSKPPEGVRVFDYPIGFNNQVTRIDRPASSGVDFSVLRRFSIYYPIARACINHLKSKITMLEWDIAPIEGDEGKGKDPRVEETKKFLKKMGGVNKNFRSVLSEIVEDLEVLDAVALYRKTTLGGKLLHYINVDGATIKLLINEDGTTPEPPDAAYQQVIRGRVVAELTTGELIYDKLHDRTNSPYGLSPLESLVVTISTALKSATYNLAYLSEGNVPEGFIQLPAEVANSVDQVKEWQDYFDAIMSGNPVYQRKLKTVPAGVEYTPTKKAEDMSFERFEKWLMQNTCAIFGVPPQDIGFTYETNRATAEVQHNVGTEKGTLVVSNFVKELLDKIIQEDLGHADLQFIWTNLNPTDQGAEMDILDKQIRIGLKSIDEVRNEQGLEPIGMPHAIYTATGPVLITDVLNPPEPVMPAVEEKEEEEEVEAKPEVNDEEEEADIRRWRRVVVKALKEGKTRFKKFDSEAIHPAIKNKIEYELQFVTDSEIARKIFDRYLNPLEGGMYRGALKLNEELDRIAREKEPN